MDNIASQNLKRNTSAENIDQSSVMDIPNSSVLIVQVVIDKDEKGYGMKVSGDNPVYVQSVKEGGPAAKAGLHAGDKIIRVNGKNVVHSTHTEVVQLIKSSSQVALTVQQESKSLSSPNSQNKLFMSLSTRITGPQPVDHEKLAQLQLEREKHYKLMIEQQRNHIDRLRSQIASEPDEKIYTELAKSEKSLHTLQQMLLRCQQEKNNSKHQRTKSSPESLSGLHNTEELKNISSDSMLEGEGYEDWEDSVPPPGTPPPPYPSPHFGRKETVRDSPQNDENMSQNITPVSDNKKHPPSDVGQIHAATSEKAQKPIISMEDDEISDQEVNQEEDHGHFRSLPRLWEHLPHLAVFTNYVLSNWNTDPNSLLFYLLTDLYKEGNAKEMRKWAFEIHSCFLIPDAPLRLNNVDENIAREIDEVLTREYDKEEILRKVFWKARSRAKEELTKQLEDFQQKRTAGLGTIFGPSDNMLSDICSDKNKELKMYESLFVEKLDPFVEELEKDDYDSSSFYKAAALATIFTRIFMLRTNCHQILERVPNFVSKEKSFKTKFMGKYNRKLVISNHQFIAQQYYTVLTCNNCHRIIYGIGPQGYQCSVCLINLHRTCVKLYDDACPGPIQKKERVLQKFKRMRQENDHKRKPTATFLQNERERRHLEEMPFFNTENEGGDTKSNLATNSVGMERKTLNTQDEHDIEDVLLQNENATTENQQMHDSSFPESSNSGPKKRNTRIVSRSESVKDQSEKRRQRRVNGRNISDPSHNTSTDLETLQQSFFNTDSGSSSNSSISFSTRLLDSPNNVNDLSQSFCHSHSDTSDLDVETDPKNWQDLISVEHLKKLNQMERKRQDVLNEFILTENSHVRNLKVLYKIFYKNIEKNQILRTDEMNLIFSNLKEVLDIHVEFNKEMQTLRKEDPILTEIGDLLLRMFESERLQNAAAMFCERQQLALEFIKERRKRDTKFDLILLECEKKRQCKRLPFQAILPTEMQRLSKYPLLLERLLNSVSQNIEITKLKKALNKSKDILNYVNEAAKLSFNKSRLEDIQKHLDTSYFERMENHQIVQEFRSIDLTKFKLILEGGMQLRRPNKGSVPVYVLLLEEAVVILHKEGDRFLLKFFQSGNPAQPQPLSPIIKTSTLLVRVNAVCKSALFLVNTSSTNSQMYDLMAEDDAKREMWFKCFSDAANAYSRKEEKSRRLLQDSDESEYVQDLSINDHHPEKAEAIQTLVDNSTNHINAYESTEINKRNGNVCNTDDSNVEKKNDSTGNSDHASGIEKESNVTQDWPLIQPAQVTIDVAPVHVAEIQLTPMEQIKRKDAEVQRALAEKENLIADFLGVPRNDFNHIAEMVILDNDSQPCLSERLMSAIYQVNQLEKFINQTLNLSEKDIVLARSTDNLICYSQENVLPETIIKIPTTSTNVIRSTVSALSTQLNLLLGETKEIEDERSKLKKEIQNLRECLHAQHNVHNFEEIENDDEINQSNDLSPEDI